MGGILSGCLIIGLAVVFYLMLRQRRRLAQTQAVSPKGGELVVDHYSAEYGGRLQHLGEDIETGGRLGKTYAPNSYS